MNRQTKRQMARQGMDPNAPGGGRARAGNGTEGGKATRQRNPAPINAGVERVGPRQYLAEVRREMRMVAWPTRSEVINSSLVVLVAVIFMTSLIFAFDWASSHVVIYIFG